MNYRERWYASHHLPYEPPRIFDCPPFRCVGIEAERMADRMFKGEFGPRQRQPGDDDEEVAA